MAALKSMPTTATSADTGKCKCCKAGGRKPLHGKRQVLAIEDDDEEEDYDDYGGEVEEGSIDHEFDLSSLQGNMRTEIEALPSELESRNVDVGDFFNGEQVAKLDEAVMT